MVNRSDNFLSVPTLSNFKRPIYINVTVSNLSLQVELMILCLLPAFWILSLFFGIDVMIASKSCCWHCGEPILFPYLSFHHCTICAFVQVSWLRLVSNFGSLCTAS